MDKFHRFALRTPSPKILCNEIASNFYWIDMAITNINIFFTGKTLSIPPYQRDYAWNEKNINDLFEDIEEALAVGGSHYLGTIILCQTSSKKPFSVVDGQQRLTTLTMLLDALIKQVVDPAIQAHYRNTFVNNPLSGPKFKLLGANAPFFQDLLLGAAVTPISDGQERLQKAYGWITTQVNTLLASGGQPLILQWLQVISDLEVLEFIEPNEGKAIRMFQTVNDRGVPLSKIDIVKSLLVYYSNRYLGGALDTHISEQFGKAFQSFSRLKRLAKEPGYAIRNINRDVFTEDDLLRYHYLSFQSFPVGATLGGRYDATVEDVLGIFLKPALKQLRNNPVDLQNFIQIYTDDLLKFFEGLETLVADTRNSLQKYLFWVIQDPSATLYPLIIRLQLLGWLNQSSGIQIDPRTLFELLELIDMRVFKFRDNPQAGIFHITRGLAGNKVHDVAQDLLNFCGKWMSDTQLGSRLSDNEIYWNSGLNRMLLTIEDYERGLGKASPFTLSALVTMNKAVLTAEHILPQDPGNSFAVKPYGFKTQDDYIEHQNLLGNLILLEKSVNSACGNAPPTDKMIRPKMYPSSKMQAVTALRANYPEGKIFSKSDLANRSSAIKKIIMSYWHI
ncbi:MAG: DUF262 domain-containing protein [Rhodoferax sp.]